MTRTLRTRSTSAIKEAQALFAKLLQDLEVRLQSAN
jgi:hypothetical protein